MTSFTIFLDGDVVVTSRLQQQIAQSRVFAADGGIRHARTLGVVPELWVGDFDSSDDGLRALFATVPRLKFPVRKAMTDGQLVVEQAISQGAKKIILCGAFGGRRLDHALAHITLAISLAQKGYSVVLSSGDQEAVPLVAGCHYHFDLPDKTPFSVVGFSALEGLTLQGAEWPVDNKDVVLGSSLTLSNHVCGTLHLQLRLGEGIMIASLAKS